jgi:hypothetical protein
VVEIIEFGSLIPIAGIFGGVAFAWIGLRYRQLSLEHKSSERAATIHAEEKRRLEQRLAVLERIVTDRGLQTAEQIEALRDFQSTDMKA